MFIIDFYFYIETAEIYESIENITGKNTSENVFLKQFCNVS